MKITLSDEEFSREYIIDDPILIDMIKTTSNFEDCLKIGILIFKNRQQIMNESFLLNDLTTSLTSFKKDIIESVDIVGSQLISLTGGNSSNLGKFEENILEKYLKIYFPYFDIVNTATSGLKCGDILIDTNTDMGKICLESKNYTTSVPKDQVEKFKRDLINSDIRYGIMISTNTKISGKDVIDYEMYEDKIIMYIGPLGFDNMILHMGIRYLQNLHKLGILTKNYVLNNTNSEYHEKIEKIENTLGITKLKINNLLTQLDEGERKMYNIFSSLRKNLIEIDCQLSNEITDLQRELEILVTKDKLEYIDQSEIKKIISVKRVDKTSSKLNLIDRLINTLERKEYKMKIDDKYLYFYDISDEYSAKLIYSTKTKLEFHIVCKTDFIEKFNKHIVSFKTDHYILSLTEDINIWNFIDDRL